jgi:hypothetical protein
MSGEDRDSSMAGQDKIRHAVTARAENSTTLDNLPQVDADILYPPVPYPARRPGPKDCIILSIGRFFGRGYDKGHMAQVAAFRALGLKGWQLHIVGRRHYEHTEDVAYHDRLVEAARGFDIYVHRDVEQGSLLICSNRRRSSDIQRVSGGTSRRCRRTLSISACRRSKRWAMGWCRLSSTQVDSRRS